MSGARRFLSRITPQIWSLPESQSRSRRCRRGGVETASFVSALPTRSTSGHESSSYRRRRWPEYAGARAIVCAPKQKLNTRGSSSWEPKLAEKHAAAGRRGRVGHRCSACRGKGQQGLAVEPRPVPDGRSPSRQVHFRLICRDFPPAFANGSRGSTRRDQPEEPCLPANTAVFLTAAAFGRGRWRAGPLDQHPRASRGASPPSARQCLVLRPASRIPTPLATLA
jgi:hypothetical protein